MTIVGGLVLTFCINSTSLTIRERARAFGGSGVKEKALGLFQESVSLASVQVCSLLEFVFSECSGEHAAPFLSIS